MLLCVAMLVGTTFAWFSDSATTGSTTITAGNLDVELDVNGAPADSEKSIFEEGKLPKLWEPGAMAVSEPVSVKNAGSLWLQYKLSISATETPVGENRLSDVIKAKITTADDPAILTLTDKAEGATQADRKTAWDGIASEPADLVSFAETGVLAPAGHVGDDGKDASEAQVIVLYWEPNESTNPDPAINPDNKYNITDGSYTEESAPKIDFTLNVFATQTAKESDSFGNGYDAGVKLADVPRANETSEDKPYDLDGGTVVYSGTEVNDGSVFLSGSGEVDLADGSAVENTDEVSGYTFRVGGDVENPANVTFTGNGTVTAPPDDRTSNPGHTYFSHAVRVDDNATVIIEGGTYEGGLYLSGTNSKIIIKGGTITRLIEIRSTIEGTDLIEIVDPDAVKDALFFARDIGKIKIPADYKWIDAEKQGPLSGTNTYKQLVPAT